MTETKVSLLEQLRIDRSAGSEHRPTGARGWQITACVSLVVAAAAVGVAVWPRAPQPVAASPADASPAAAQGATRQALMPGSAAAGPPAAAASLLDASGYIVAQRQATVSAKNAYKVREVLFQEGEPVSEGQVLARMDDSNTLAALEAAKASLLQGQASLEAARVALADARPIFERNERQLQEQVISAQDFDTAKATFDSAQTAYAAQQAALVRARASLVVAQRNEDDTILRAPFSGVVTTKNAQPGEMISPMATSGFTRTGICTIVDMGSLEAEVDVSESFLERVHPGQPAAVRLNAYPSWTIPGKVLAIIPTADRSKATVKVRVGLEARDARVLPEMGARVAFLAGGEDSNPAKR